MARVPRVKPRLKWFERESWKAALGFLAVLSYAGGLYNRQLGYNRDLKIWQTTRQQAPANAIVPPEPVPAIGIVDLVIGLATLGSFGVLGVMALAKDRSMQDKGTPEDLEGSTRMLYELLRL